MSDLISRRTLYLHLENMAFKVAPNGKHHGKDEYLIRQTKYETFQQCMESVMSLPSAERVGHWIEHENPKDVFSIECSECGCWFLHEHLVRNSFCPNCGARMMEGEEE